MFTLLNNQNDASEKTPAAESGSADSKAEQARSKIDINSYQDPEGLTLGKMTLGLWLVEHRLRLIAASKIALAVFAAVTLGYGIFGFGSYFIVGMAADRRLAEELTQNHLVGHDYFLSIKARELQYSRVEIFAADDDERYDFLVEIRNPNLNHFGHFSYAFTANGETVGRGTAFVLPGERKYVFSLGQGLDRRPASVVFSLGTVDWYRLDRHEYPDWDKFQSERLRFTVSDIEFTPAKSTILSEKIVLNDLSFTLENKSAFNYYEVDLPVLLFRQGEIVGVNAFRANKLLSGEARRIQATWPGRLGRIDEVRVLPEVDITREDAYMKFPGQPDSLNYPE